MGQVIDLSAKRRERWRDRPAVREDTRRTISLDAVARIVCLCKQHGLTREQVAQVFLDLEKKGYYA